MKIVRSFLAASILALSVTATMAPTASAHGQVRRVVTWYADAELTNIIGGYTVYCDGHSQTWGDFSEYETTDRYTCS